MEMRKELIKKLIEWVESSQSFLKGEIPDYINELIASELIKTWMNVSLITLGIIFLSGMGFLAFNKSNTYEKSYECPSIYFLVIWGALIFVIFFCGGLISEIHTLINIYVSPRVFVLNHLKNLLG